MYAMLMLRRYDLMSEPTFLIEVEQAAAALKRLIDDLDADSVADLFSYAFGVEAVTSLGFTPDEIDAMTYTVFPDEGDPEAFEVAKESLTREGFIYA